MDSILESVKKMLGNGEGYNYFDPDIIMCINSVFSTLYQLGVGPEGGYQITGPDEKWTDYTDDTVLLGFIKPYMFTKVKLTFDPPQSSFVLAAYEKQIQETEWRLNVHVDPANPKWGGMSNG